MSAYDFNPDMCLQILHGIAEEIPSGVSDGGEQSEIDRFVKISIVSRAKKMLDWLWRTYQMPQKLKHLGELEKKAPKSVAWRPTTGKVEVNPIIAKHWIDRKKELLREIEHTRSKSAMVVPYLQMISKQSELEQLEEVSSLEQRIAESRNNIIKKV